MLAYCAEANVASCSSIFVGGASDTLVKLPDGCGKAPFAHVVSFVPMTKQLPAALRKLIGKEKVSVYELTVCAFTPLFLMLQKLVRNSIDFKIFPIS